MNPQKQPPSKSERQSKRSNYIILIALIVLAFGFLIGRNAQPASRDPRIELVETGFISRGVLDGRMSYTIVRDTQTGREYMNLGGDGVVELHPRNLQ